MTITNNLSLKEFENLDCFEFLDKLVKNSLMVATHFENYSISSEHLLYTILKFNEIDSFFKKEVNANTEELKKELEEYFKHIKQNEENKAKIIIFSNNFKFHFQRMITLIHFFSNINFTKDYVLLEILNSILQMEETFSSRLLKKYGLSKEHILNHIDKNKAENEKISLENLTYESALKFIEEIENKRTKKDQTNQSKIWKYCTNLNDLVKAKKIDPIIGREEEIKQMEIILNKRKKSNVILVGPPGVGKTALVEGLAYKIVNKKCSQKLRNKIIASLDLISLISGSKYRGELEERIKNIFQELEKNENIILFVDEIHNLIGYSSSGPNSQDISNMIKPYLLNGKIKNIGATTDEEFHRYMEKDKAFLRRFQKIDILEPSEKETEEILLKLKHLYEKHHNVVLTKEIISKIVYYSKKFMHNKLFPDKAFDLLDQTCSSISTFHTSKNKIIITEDHIIDELAKILRIPSSSIRNQDIHFDQCLEKLKENIFGQDEILERIYENLLVSKAGLREKNKTYCSLLFLGPTGVGKTETARNIAKILNCPLIKFDMSEYMEQHSVSKLIGSPPGYIGHESEGKLIFEIEKNPCAVLLLDEIEKAHPDILNILLQIMDDGVLTSSKGKKVNFSNIVLVMTSNAGSDRYEKQNVGFFHDQKEEKLENILMDYFSPEFRNRLDDILLFNKINKNIVEKIIEKRIKEINELLAEKNIKISITDNLMKNIAEQSFEEKYGARNINRIIDRKIKIPLSKYLILGNNKKENIILDIKNDQIVIL
ncbi:MAG: ATP-dependent Clp protease ATP-binding subunit [Candidatus Dojkabacteria bacterium]|nr:ATP-dependent Clp protease ATP-binding subunit [Candidatus Dojkabacteria bacterium]